MMDLLGGLLQDIRDDALVALALGSVWILDSETTGTSAEESISSNTIPETHLFSPPV